MVLSSFILFVGIASSACPEVRAQDDAMSASICDLADTPAIHEGRRVELHGRFVTDGVHFEALMDDRCPRGRRYVDLAFDANPRTIQPFLSARAGQCQARNEEALCLLEADVVLTGRLRRVNGGTILEVENVSSWEFR